MRRRFKLINIVVLLILAILVIGAGVVVIGTKDKMVEAPGQLKPVRYDIVRANLDGVIDTVYVESGQLVSKGDTLLTLRTPDLTLASQQAEKALSLAKFDLAQLREEYNNLVESESFETQSAFANLYQAQRSAEINQHKYVRAESLFVKGHISSEERDDAKLTYELSQSYYLSLKDRASLLRRRYELQIEEQEERVALNQQEYEHAVAKLGNAVVVAPIDGEMLTSNLKALINKRISLGEDLMEIGDCTELLFIAEVAEADVTQITMNLEAQVYINAFPHRKYRTFEGTVKAVSPLPKQTDWGVTYQVEILMRDILVEVDSSFVPLRPGLMGKAEIIVEHDVRLLELLLDKHL